MAIKIKRIAAFAMCLLLVFGLFGLFMLVRKHEREKEEVAAKEEYEQVTQNFRDRYFQNKDNLYLLWDGSEFPVVSTGEKLATVNFRKELTVDWGDSQITNGGSEHIYTDNQRYHLIVVSGDIQASDLQNEMFFRCTYLRKVAVPDGITIVPPGFCNRSGVDEAILPESVERIGSWAFHEDKMEEIKLPNALKSIGQNAFSYTNLKTVELPENVNVIEKEAFLGCTWLKTVRFKGALPEKISADIFTNCGHLSTIIVPRHEFVKYKECSDLSVWNDKIVYE